MSKTRNTSCIRCGKKRIFSKTWKEKQGCSVITFSQFVCPDKDCQKIVEKKLKKEKEHLETIQSKALERRKRNIRNRKIQKKSKIPKKRS